MIRLHRVPPLDFDTAGKDVDEILDSELPSIEPIDVRAEDIILVRPFRHDDFPRARSEIIIRDVQGTKKVAENPQEICELKQAWRGGASLPVKTVPKSLKQRPKSRE